MQQELKEKLAKIRLLACDFDGVMTDGKVYVSEDGRETVRCSRKDGMGIGLLRKNGIVVVVISTEANPVVTKRCDKLKITCWQKIESTEGKLQILQNHVRDLGFSPEEIAFMGDDINDMAALKFAGIRLTVADGHESIKEIADYVTKAKGGDHAIREVCELILKAKEIKIAY